MDTSFSHFVRAASLEELNAKGRLVVHGRHRPILLVQESGRVFALDNRCPHMGFPLDRGSIDDGILTCHWHHARFDLASGCTFDLWADDVPTCPVEIRGGEIWVKPVFDYADPAAHWRRRLADGLAHNLSLVIAKAVHGQLAAGSRPSEIVRQAAVFGTRNRDGWSTGLTILTALGQLLPVLPEEETYLALFHGARRVAEDCEGAAPRRERAPLASQTDLATLKRWSQPRRAPPRHREAATDRADRHCGRRHAGARPHTSVFAAEPTAPTADGGHSLLFHQQGLRVSRPRRLEQHAADVLPSVVGQLAEARGAEELTAWRAPDDLIALCDAAALELPFLFARRVPGGWSDHAVLAETLLAGGPTAIIDALKSAARAGASPADLGKALAYAAALRVARFGTANEHSDWETAHHVFTYANALHQALKRIGSAATDTHEPVEAARGLLHGALALHLARYLNVPPAALPGEDGDRLDALPAGPRDIRAELLDTFDRQQQVGAAARLVAGHLILGHAPEALIATLARALLREDAGFHAFQMLEAGVRQFAEWGNGAAGRHILIAVARYLAAHSPTERASLQTADIARRLMRGGELHAGTATAR